MICKNCGTNNKEGVTYCAYCGKALNDNDYIYSEQTPQHSGDSKNLMKIIAIVVSICLVLGGSFILLKESVFSEDVSIEDVVVDGEYEMEGDTYVFGVNKTVIIEPKINSSSDKLDLSYKLDDSSIANVVKLNNKCSIVGLKEQGTNLNIYGGDKILKVLKISFKDDSKSKSATNGNSSSSTVKNKTTTRNNSSTKNNSSSKNNDTTQSSSSSIPLDDITYFMSGYFNDYVDAMNYGDFSIISGELTTGGNAYNQYKKSIPHAYEKGITISLRGFDKVSAKKVSNGVYSITYTVDWEIYNPEEETYRLQREYADYIVKQSGSSYKLDRLENWEILSKQYI